MLTPPAGPGPPSLPPTARPGPTPPEAGAYLTVLRRSAAEAGPRRAGTGRAPRDTPVAERARREARPRRVADSERRTRCRGARVRGTATRNGMGGMLDGAARLLVTSLAPPRLAARRAHRQAPQRSTPRRRLGSRHGGAGSAAALALAAREHPRLPPPSSGAGLTTPPESGDARGPRRSGPHPALSPAWQPTATAQGLEPRDAAGGPGATTWPGPSPGQGDTGP